MTLVACTDLDRTLIYSPSALALTGADHDAPRLICVEVYRGQPLSFVTDRAARLLERFAQRATLVPTTTRTPEQYARVHLLGAAPRFAICANGGHLLVDGVDDPAWRAAVDERLAGSGVALGEVQERLAADVAALGPQIVHSSRTASDLFAYLVVDRPQLPSSWAEDLGGWCAERGWRLSVQGRKVYCVPAGLTKAAAAHEVASRCGAADFVAAGDSLLDAELLEAAVGSIRPAAGELHDAGWLRAGTAVTRQAGVLAGEEIAAWLVSRIPID